MRENKQKFVMPITKNRFSYSVKISLTKQKLNIRIRGNKQSFVLSITKNRHSICKNKPSVISTEGIKMTYYKLPSNDDTN